MRILLVANGFPPFSTHGTEMYTYNLARTLREAGHAVHVFFPNDRGETPYTTMHGEYNGVPYTAVQRQTEPQRDLRYSYCDPGIEPLFVLLLRSFMPDVVHFTYVLIGLSAALIQWTQRAGIPAIVTTTDVHFPCMRGQLLDVNNALCAGPEGGKRCTAVCYSFTGWSLDPAHLLPEDEPVEHVWSPRYDEISPLVLRDRYLKTVLRGADVVIAPTRWVYNVLSDWGIPPDRMIQAEYGIDDTILHPFTYRPADHVRVGYIGQLLPFKGPQTLFEAFTYCDAPAAELKVYGDYAYGPAAHFLREVVRYTVDPRIRFHGTFPHDEIGDVLGGMDVLVVSSIWHENSPLVLRNAVATGTPVIVSDMEGMRPYVRHMGNGLLYRAGDVDDLYAKLQLVLDNPDLLAAFRAHRIHTTTIAEDVARLLGIYAEAREARQEAGVGADERGNT